MNSWYAIFLFFLLFTLPAAGQKINNVWAFGNKSGLNFNTEPASFFKSKTEPTRQAYFTSSICDENGQLKFYTDGLKVWNRDGFLMPKYNNWWPWTDTVMPLITKFPGRDSLYFIFGVCTGLNENRLLAFTTKMYEAGDLEEVVYPRPASLTSYYTTLTEGASLLLAGTAHCNQKDIWVVTHTPGALKAFLVTENGLNPSPVISPVGPGIMPVEEIRGALSNMKFSGNGERMVIPLLKENKMVVMDFDNQAGSFSNPKKISVPAGHTLEDVELSPDGNKLYFGSWYTVEIDPGVPGGDLHPIYQMDLEAGVVSEIEQSAYIVNGIGDRVSCVRTCILLDRTLQLGPDGKIYASMRYTGGMPNIDLTISVIEEPNKLRSDCRYRMNLVKTTVQPQFINYNYVRSGSFSLEENGIQVQKRTCADKPAEFGLLFNRVDSVKWDFGDPASGSANFSTLLAPQHFYPSPGTYTVSAIIYSRCFSDTAYKQIVIQPEVAIKVPEFIRDTFACKGQQLTLDVRLPGATAYLWENGLIFPNRVMDTAGKMSVMVFNECSFDKKEFVFAYKDCPCDVFVPTGFTPNNDGLNDLFKPAFECFAVNYKMRIYSRYGGILFETNQPEKGWNGKKGEMTLPTGVYVWMIQYQNPNTKETFLKKGTVTLIR